MVVDELILYKDVTGTLIDSYNNEMIDEIVYEGQSFHFAKQKDLTGTSGVVADNAVDEPIISLGVSGNTTQQTYTGYNLLNKENFTNEGLKNETEFSTWANTCMSTENLLAMLKPNTTYTISYELEGAYDLAEGETFHNGSGFLIWVGSTIPHWLRYGKFVRKGERVQYSASFTTRDDVSAYVLKVYSHQIKRGTEYPSTPVIIRNVQIVEGSIAKPYEPYVGGIPSPNPDYPQHIENANSEGMSVVLHGENLFNQEEITIPSSVEVDGATVELRFAKQGEKADKLIVDKISCKVAYEQWVKTEPLPITSATWGIPTTANQVKTLRATTYMYNSFSNMNIGEGFLMNKFKEVFDITLDEQGFYMAAGSLLGWVGIRVNRDLLETQNSTGIKKWLQTQQDEGDPVLFNYALVTPITHDITNTDLGQSLLALATRKGTNYLEITSYFAPSKTDLSYWRQIIPNE